jgi:hypothetical protein
VAVSNFRGGRAKAPQRQSLLGHGATLSRPVA